MRSLRTVSTRRLLAMLAGLIAAVAAGTAIAGAASGPGPVPPHTSLARALHRALGAPAVQGITARISFTNHLIDSADIQGSNPILAGASGRLWVSGDQRLRLELQSDNGDAEIVVNNGSFLISDPSSSTVYEGSLPAHTGGAKEKQAKHETIPSVAQIQSDLGRVMKRLDLSGAIPGDVAGHAAYTLRVSPKHDSGLLGSAELAWDAARGVPLRIAIYATHDSSPVLELEVTDISYGPVPSSDFAVPPPVGAKVVKISTPSGGPDAGKRGSRSSTRHSRRAALAGSAAVAGRLPFKLADPKKLVGLHRQTVKLLKMGGKAAALVGYGQGLGGVAVIEQAASPTSAQSSRASGAGGGGQGVNLPTVSIHGVTVEELDTALGTLVRFTRGGVSYIVIGSVGPKIADGVARGL